MGPIAARLEISERTRVSFQEHQENDHDQQRESHGSGDRALSLDT
jgi:hypothetical protein